MQQVNKREKINFTGVLIMSIFLNEKLGEICWECDLENLLVKLYLTDNLKNENFLMFL